MAIRRAGQFLVRHWPCAAALAVLGAAVAALLILALRRCAGQFVYPLDDAYIHMAVARNLARHGVWGISAAGFSSPCSSLLWPLLLAAAYLVVGVRDALPLMLNALCGAGLLVWLWRRHVRLGHPAWYGFLSLLTLSVLTPLPSTMLLGMEHTLHALLMVAFAGAAARVLAAGRPTPRQILPLWLLAPLLAMARYEALFVLAAACLLLLCRGRWRLALGLGAWGAAPLVAFGCFSVAHGWHFLPNSVLIKSGLAGHAGDFQALSLNLTLGRIVDNHHLLLPFIAALALLIVQLRGRADPWEPGILFTAVYLISFPPLYMTLQPSLFSRYDASLCAFGLAAVLLGLPEAIAALHRPAPAARRSALWRHPAWLALVLVPALPWLWIMTRGFLTRPYFCAALVPPAAANIHQQQYQMGRFVQTHYAGTAVAVNDIGAVSYYGGVDCLDLFGLASVEVLDARRRGEYSDALLARLAARKKVKVTLFYRDWVGGVIPPGWREAGVWTIPAVYVCGGATVSICAATPAEWEPLKARLRQFASRLPRVVSQSGAYCD